MTSERRQDTNERVGQILMTRDVACMACGYNLRGLAPGPPQGRCPECGTPVKRSVAPPLLESVDARWVRRTARGTRLVAIGMGVWAATGAALAVIAGALGATVWLGGFTGWRVPSMVVATVASVGGALGLLLVGAGQVMATHPQRELDADLALLLWRRGVRLTLGALGATAVIGGIGVGALNVIEAPRAVMWLGMDLYVPGVALGSVVAVAVFVGYMREMLVRVPDAGLGRRCEGRLRALILAILLGLVAFFLANTLLVPLGAEAQGVGWIVAVCAALMAIGATAWLALGVMACAGRIGSCARGVGGGAEASVDRAEAAA